MCCFINRVTSILSKISIIRVCFVITLLHLYHIIYSYSTGVVQVRNTHHRHHHHYVRFASLGKPATFLSKETDDDDTSLSCTTPTCSIHCGSRTVDLQPVFFLVGRRRSSPDHVQVVNANLQQSFQFSQ